MKYLRLFEDVERIIKNQLDHDKKVLEGNQRIFTELDILEDFKNSLIDNNIKFDRDYTNNIYVNFKSENYLISNDNAANTVNKFIEEIDKYKDIELPTFHYHISISAQDVNIEDIKEELDVLNNRFNDLTTCKVVNQNINIQTKSNKVYTNKIDSNFLPKHQRVEGNYLITETSDIQLTVVYMNKKSDRYK